MAGSLEPGEPLGGTEVDPLALSEPPALGALPEPPAVDVPTPPDAVIEAVAVAGVGAAAEVGVLLDPALHPATATVEAASRASTQRGRVHFMSDPFVGIDRGAGPAKSRHRMHDHCTCRFQATHRRTADRNRTAGRNPSGTPPSIASSLMVGTVRRPIRHTGGMQLPVALPIEPMLAKAATAVPQPDSVTGGLGYEPKWDGFRCLVLRDGDQVELGSRGSKPLTRYFPELLEAVREHLPQRCALDCEIVVRSGEPGAERLDWEALSQRIHPAESRVRKLSAETPAEIIAFDLLALGDEDLMQRPFADRRRALEELFEHRAAGSPIHLTRFTADADLARHWFDQFEGAGLDGVVAKPLQQPYQPGKRAMIKVKHSRTAEAVLIGYRIHKSGQGVGSLLLGLYTEDRELVNVGGIAAFTDARRLELIDELYPLVQRDSGGDAVRGETDRSRFSASKDVSFVSLRPERVVEVKFDQMEGRRFRHAVGFLRWRPDRDPESCTIDQVDRAIAYDLAAVLDD